MATGGVGPRCSTAHHLESGRSRRVCATATVYAVSEEEAVTRVEAMPQDELEFKEIEFYEDADSEIEDIEVADVELISEERDEAAAG